MTKVRSFFGKLLGPLLRLPVFSLRPPRRRLQRYALTAFVGISIIVLAAWLVLRLTPSSYTSRWTLILPGSGSEANLILQGIGQASSNSASPYASISRSPRVNYREIVMSDTVLSLAAEIAGISQAEFGRPRVKLVQQSSLMSFSISAGNPELAQLKAAAVNSALRQTLDRLRSDELALREAGMHLALLANSSLVPASRGPSSSERNRTRVSRDARFTTGGFSCASTGLSA